MSKPPTAAQKRIWGLVFEVGCMACRQDGNFSFPQIHHVKEYGKRNHGKVFGICPPHHSPVCAVPGVPNRHLNPIEFREKYGTDQELFEKCQKLIGEKTCLSQQSKKN